jgi:C1A family cysteine protease
MPSFSALRAAYDAHSPTDYRRIVGSGEQKLQAVRRALADGFPVIFGCGVDDAFCQGAFDATKPLSPPAPNRVVGGHCMTLVGYDGDAFHVLNSWSEEWGEQGYCWFAPEYLLECTDLWAIHHTPVQGEK